MTLAEYRGISKAEEKAVQAPREAAHPGPAEYVKIGLTLAVVTMVEVALFYADVSRWALVVTLVLLSAVKFSLVVLWFMHLKFDARLFSWLFVGGLALASALFVVMLATLGAGLV